MAFTPYDGTNPLDANSYIDVSYADEYFDDRGNEDWSGADNTNKQQALIKATDYIALRWGDVFRGRKENPTSDLEFPRLGLYIYGTPVEGIPEDINKACAEYAVRALSSELSPDPVVDERGLTVAGVSKRVASLQTSTQYASAVSEQGNTFRKYPKADAYVSPYTRSGNRTYR